MGHGTWDMGDAMIKLRMLMVGACAAACLGAKCYYDTPEPVVGTWGGQHMGLVVSDTGARIEFDCAAGAIRGPLHVESNGDFSWQGYFYPGHGGPVRIDEKPEPHAAVYSAQ